MNPLRRQNQFGRQLDALLDRMIDRVNLLLRERGGLVSSVRDQVFNDSSSWIAPGLILGRDETGTIAAAKAGISPIAPVWVSLSPAGASQPIDVLVVGKARVMAESDDMTASRGALAWLSSSIPGAISVSAPTSGHRYMVGRFSETSVSDEGLIEVDVFLFPQAGGTL